MVFCEIGVAVSAPSTFATEEGTIWIRFIWIPSLWNDWSRGCYWCNRSDWFCSISFIILDLFFCCIVLHRWQGLFYNLDH